MNQIHLSIISDEISSDFNEIISFCSRNNLEFLDFRMIDSRNIVEFSLQEIKKIKKELDFRGIHTSAISSPLFKWFQEKRSHHVNGDFFGVSENLSYFDKLALINKTFKIAEVLEARFVRIFSGIKNPDISNSNFLEKEKSLFGYCQELSDKLGIQTVIENEPICNVSSLSDLNMLSQSNNLGNLNILLDPGNLYFNNERLHTKDLYSLLPVLGCNLHVKDFSLLDKEYCIFGEGDIPYQEIFKFFKVNFDQECFFTLESHLKDIKATQKSLDNIKLTLDYIN